MIKTAKTIKAGDVYRTEFGDYGNYARFVFVSCEAVRENCTRINVKDIGSDEVYDVYEFTPIDRIEFDVVEESEGEEE